MTNRERAVAAGLCSLDDAERELDAAERRGRIAALEWMMATYALPWSLSRKVVDKLTELKAEENKR